MANKQLTVTVRLNTKQAENGITRLVKQIDRMSNAMNKTNPSQTNKQLTQSDSLVNRIANKVRNWATNQQQVTTAAKSTSTVLDSVGRKLKQIAATYVGLMGTKALVNTTDTIISAKNKLNNIEGVGSELIPQTMDKTYAAAMRSRSNYGDMLSNVSKTMILAGDSFNNNVDNAIRFQEIMAKAYTVGGASAQEASTSMYQLVQALGAGVLAGDELRSVREGAPLAYKEIEKFAQGVFNTTESLKEMASKGIITSDIIVAAIMDAETKINKSFDNTKMTFGQAWDGIKSMATKALTPVAEKLEQILNSDAGKALLDGLGTAMIALGDVLLWIIEGFGKFFAWCSKNWYWLQWVVAGVVGAILVALALLLAKAIIAGVVMFVSFLMGLSPLYWIIIVIGLVVAAIVWLANVTKDGCDFMVAALFLVAAALLVIGIISIFCGNVILGVVLFIIGVLLALVALFLACTQQIVGAVYWLGAVFYNVGMGIANFFIAVWNWILAAGYNCGMGIANLFIALGKSIKAICTNIGIAFENAWTHATNAFWSFVSACLNGVKWLEPVIDAISKVFGGDGFSVDGLIKSVEEKRNKQTKEYVSVGDAWNEGINTYGYKDLGDAWSNGINTFEYKNLGDSYDKGAQVGANIQNAVNKWATPIKNAIADFGVNDLFKDKTDNPADKLKRLPDPNDPSLALTGGFDPSSIEDDIAEGLKKLGNIDENTKDLKDDDFEWMRKVAEMEWRNEFTTAEIKIDMTNHNTVNGDRDLDGIVEYLSDALRSEMTAVANGVHYST